MDKQSDKRETPTGHSPRWMSLLVIVFIALAVRVVYLLFAAQQPTWLSPGMDAEIYRNWADAILSGHSPTAAYYRAPLYPTLIALLGKLFNGDSFWPIRVLQVLVSAIATGVLANLSFRWFGKTAGWATGLVWAFYGMSIYFDGEGLIASLFTSGLIFLLAVLDLDHRRRNWWSFLLPVVLLGVLTALRANALVWWPILFWVYWKQPIPALQAGLKRILKPAVAILLMLLIISPILIHNVRAGGGLAISTQGGINLFLGNHNGATGAFSVDPEFGNDWTKEEVDARASGEVGKTLNDTEVSRFYSRKALQFWMESPGEALALTGRKVLLLLNGREIANNRVLQPFLETVWPPFYWLSVIGFPVVLLLGLPFLVINWKNFPATHSAILFILIYSLSLLFFFIAARYRFPIAPILALFAGGSVQWIVSIREHLPTGKLALFSEAIVLLFLTGMASYFHLPIAIAFSVLVLIYTAFVIRHVKPVLPSSKGWATGVFVAVLIVLCFGIQPIGAIIEQDAWRLHEAHAELRLGNLDRAEVLYQEILREGYHPEASLNLGVAYLRHKKYREAYKVFSELTRRQPSDTRGWNNLGVAAEYLGKSEEALSCYREAYSLNPGFQDARLNLLRLLEVRARELVDDPDSWQTVLDYLTEALEIEPNNERLRQNYDRIFAALNTQDTILQ